MYRFAVAAPLRQETSLRVQTRYLRRRSEQIERQSYVNLQRFLRQGLIDRATHDLIATILGLLEKIGDHQKRLEAIKQERQKIYEAQKQIQGNMQALSNTGKEGQMRAQYVDRLEETEQNLQVLAQEEGQLEAEIKRLEKEIERGLQG